MTGHVPDDLDALLGDSRITRIGLLFETAAGLMDRLAPQLASHGLSHAEFEVLLRLGRSPNYALRMTDLAAQTQLTTSGITRVVDRLERHNLVERRACATDRRGSFATVTPTGLARLAEVLPGHLEQVEKWFTAQLTVEQLDALLVSLRGLRDAVFPDATAGVKPRSTV